MSAPTVGFQTRPSTFVFIHFRQCPVPNSGVQVWNDCGNFSVKEEVDLKINKASIQAESPYYYQVHYKKYQYSVNGAINLSYQRDNSPTHDHLDKVLYSN